MSFPSGFIANSIKEKSKRLCAYGEGNSAAELSEIQRSHLPPGFCQSDPLLCPPSLDFAAVLLKLCKCY